MAAIRNHTSLIEGKRLRFLITDRPTTKTLDSYVEVLKKNEVVALIRVCEPSYETDQITAAGTTVHDMGFPDGDPPPEDVITKWHEVTDQVTTDAKAAGSTTLPCIAVHCVAGLGRAPVMVALSLIEEGMTPEDSVIFIREKRRGAINSKQLLFLRKYKRRRPNKTGGGTQCICM